MRFETTSAKGDNECGSHTGEHVEADKTLERSELGNGQVKRVGAKSGAVGALAVGALALGAVAIGAFAIGRLAIRRLAVGHARIRSLAIEELAVKRLRVGELIMADQAAERKEE